MALGVTKSITGGVVSFVVTDSAGSTLTIAVDTTGVTGNVTTFTSSGAMHSDGLGIVSNLLLQIQIGLIPAAGAWGLLP